jgi:transposase
MENFKNLYSIIAKLLRSGVQTKTFIDRLNIIQLYLQGGLTYYKIAKQLSIDWATAKKWILEWEGALTISEDIEKGLELDEISPSIAIKHLELILSDKPRSGRNPTFTEEEINQILALYAENPKDLGLPFSDWNVPLLRDEAMRREIVKSISKKHLWVILKKSGDKSRKK